MDCRVSVDFRRCVFLLVMWFGVFQGWFRSPEHERRRSLCIVFLCIVCVTTEGVLRRQRHQKINHFVKLRG